MRRVWLFGLLACAAGCDPQKADWGLAAIRDMQTPPDDPSLSCGVEVVTARAAERGRCEYAAGTLAADSLGSPPELLGAIPIRHVIIAMRENRSFDHLLGKLHERGQPGVEQVPASFSNRDEQGTEVFPAQATTTCIDSDPGHQS